MSAEAVEHLALNVYCWGEAAQDHVAAACLAPTVRALRGAGVVRRFFFTRFDARGPHLAAYVGVAPGRAGEAGEALAAALERHLAAHPCTTALGDDELSTRHHACRGAELSSIDAEPGFAENGSYRLAPAPDDGFPCAQTRGVAAQGELWELLTEVALWAIARGGQAPGAPAQWVAAVDGALHRAGTPAYAWWRWYATTLMMGLSDRLAGGEDAFVAGIPRLLGEKNLAAARRAWDGAATAPFPCGAVDRLIELVVAEDGRGQVERFRLFRLVNHCVLAQLGSPVRLRIPLVLYALHRARPAAPAA